MLTQLWLPILLSAVALFFASFLSWMVLQLHKQDWLKISREDEFIGAVASLGLERGRSYMFPSCGSKEEMKNPEFQRKIQVGPCGIVTVFGSNSMGQNLALTFVTFLIASVCLAYLGSIGLRPGNDFITVFRFYTMAGLLTFLTSTVQYSIWFKNRITGYVIESVAYAVIVGLIFAGLWPAV